MTGKGRASIFESVEEVPIDISAFTARATAPTAPTQEQVKSVSEAANFPSREVAKPSGKSTRAPRRYRTGRNVQFSAKASQETIERFYRICDRNGWVMGSTLERAVDALEREMAK
jgi:hypothetical protein